MKLGKPANQGWSTVVGSKLVPRHWLLAPRHQQMGKLARISFFSILRLGNLADTISDPIGYIRTSRTHPGHQEKYTIEEIIERRKRSSNLVPEFCTFLCNFFNFYQFSSSPLLPSQSLLIMIYSFITMLGQKLVLVKD